MKVTNPKPTSPALVSYAQLKAQLRMDDDTERLLIEDYIDAVTSYAENAMDVSLLQRTITATYYEHSFNPTWTDYGLCRRLHLPRGPVQSITSITDANSTNITNYTLEAFGNTDELKIKQVFTAPLTVVYVAGYGANLADVPSDIKMAMRAHVASLWRIRESISDKTLISVPDSTQEFYRVNRRTAPVA